MLRKILVFVLVLLCVPVLALAQEDLTETYTSDDGSRTLRYPAGWTAAGFGPVIRVSSSIWIRGQSITGRKSTR
jgi:hypothetical protein